MATDIAELAFAGWQAEEERTRQANIVLVRDYYDGDQHVQLTQRQKEYLGFVKGGRFALNYCATVVNAVWERLIVAALASKDKAFSEAAWAWWQRNRMDEKQDGVHRGAVRDGEYFVIVDLDEEMQPRFTPHPRYTDPLSGGSGFGCKAHYPNDMTSLPMQFASKRWTETVTLESGKRETRQRMTVYYPNQIRKYVQKARSGESGWDKYQDEGDTSWPLPHVDATGKPLGIQVIHFRNPDEKSEIWDALPPQDGINKTSLDLLAAADAAGFPIYIAQGFSATTDGKLPESDGGNYLELTPGCWIEIPKDGKAGRMEAADLTPLVNALDGWITKLAQVTDTPANRFQITRQVAAEGTLKQQEAVLLSKVRVRQVRFGNSWEDVLYMARRLANTAGAGLNEDAMLEVEWVPAATRDEKEHIETLGLKREKLNVPLETLWAEAGYSQEEIDAMLATEEYQARLNMQRQAAAMFGQERPGENEDA